MSKPKVEFEEEIRINMMCGARGECRMDGSFLLELLSDPIILTSLLEVTEAGIEPKKEGK